MVSVLCLTYKRKPLLEEAVESFLRQQPSLYNCEMVIINDCPDIEYYFDHPLIKIFNCKERFKSVSEKLEWGYKQCKYNWVYRLDDDDLLAEYAISFVGRYITHNPHFDVYRSRKHFYFEENKFVKMGSSVNNGNIYSKNYLDRIKFPDKSGHEDEEITFGHNASIFSFKEPTMIYRWGMSTNHISGYGVQSSEYILKASDELLKEEKGKYTLIPHWKKEYWNIIKNPLE